MPVTYFIEIVIIKSIHIILYAKNMHFFRRYYCVSVDLIYWCSIYEKINKKVEKNILYIIYIFSK